ncbi:hypothetical protein GYMLUDRAFT_32319, partial [Collybiopsis luxurians FD-317 M1]
MTYQPPSGYPGNLSPTQQSALDQFKKELREQNETLFAQEGEDGYVEARMSDAALLRFLRARKFDIALAKAMWLANEKWRKEFGVDEIVKSFDYNEKAQVDKYYPQFYHKVDKDGRPIYIERLGFLDINALYSITTPDRQLKRLVFEYEKSMTERLPACSNLVGHPVSTYCTILDLKDVSLRNFYRVKDYVMSAASIGQDHYPETMGKFYIINAPFLFTGVWSVVKPWLDEVTVAKIQVLGAKNKEVLLAQIPEENLPKFFGGSCECPDGCSMSDAGPWSH